MIFQNMNKEIYLLGIGHNSIVYVEMLEQLGYTIKGLYHYNAERTGEMYFGYPILGSFEDLYALGDLNGKQFALSMGDNKFRRLAFEKIKSLGGFFPTIIHPKADVSRHAILGEGVVVHSNALVHPEAKIGDNSVVSCNCSVIHQSVMGKHCYVAGHALIGAYSHIGDNVFIGIGAILISSKVKSIGDGAVIGAGAVVSAPVEAHTVVAGVPARVIKVLEN